MVYGPTLYLWAKAGLPNVAGPGVIYPLPFLSLLSWRVSSQSRLWFWNSNFQSGCDLVLVFRLVFAVYIFFTALVLVNLLIAMMTNRYKQARRAAECTWRFNAVAFGLRIQTVLSCLTRRGEGAFCPPNPVYRDGRYLLQVRDKTHRSRRRSSGGQSSTVQQQLRADVTRLAADVRHIRDRIDSLSDSVG